MFHTTYGILSASVGFHLLAHGILVRNWVG